MLKVQSFQFHFWTLDYFFWDLLILSWFLEFSLFRASINDVYDWSLVFDIFFQFNGIFLLLVNVLLLIIFVIVVNLLFLCDCSLYVLEQANRLQWALASVPLIKALQHALSFLFWYAFILESWNYVTLVLIMYKFFCYCYLICCLLIMFCFRNSCFYTHVCSLWTSLEAYVIGVLFQTITFVSFMLISNGYCITCEHLSASERRMTSALGCVFYLTLVGYRASIPYFFVSFLISSLIFRDKVGRQTL